MRSLLAALIVVLAPLTAARAQPVADHLKCYKVKDPQAKTSFTADLTGLVAEPGCKITVPAVTACVPTTKTNVTPTPAGGGATGTPNTFFCYKVKCPKAKLPALSGRDQFGTRVLVPSAAKLLCAPVTPGTTTPTSSTTSTTIICPMGETDCSGVCTNTTIDPANCGGCGRKCLQGESCVETSLGSHCNCLSPNTLCGTHCNVMPCTCSDLLTDSSNCGMCGTRCPVGTDCVQGTCLRTCSLDSGCFATEFCCLLGVDMQGCCGSLCGHCSSQLPDGAACSRSRECAGGCCCLSINCTGPTDTEPVCSVLRSGPFCSTRTNNTCTCL